VWGLAPAILGGQRKGRRLRRLSPRGDAKWTSAKRQGGPDPPETKVGVSFLNSGSRMSKLKPAPFYCTECKAKYELVRTEFPAGGPIREYYASDAALCFPDARAHSSSNTSLWSAPAPSHGGHLSQFSWPCHGRSLAPSSQTLDPVTSRVPGFFWPYQHDNRSVIRPPHI
jgi:hypothetical protein